MVLDEPYEIGTSSLKGIGKVCKGRNPKLAVSSPHPRTKPEFAHGLPKQSTRSEITIES